MSATWLRTLRARVELGAVIYGCSGVGAEAFCFAADQDDLVEMATRVTKVKVIPQWIFRLRPASAGKPDDFYLVPTRVNVEAPESAPDIKWRVLPGYDNALARIDESQLDRPMFALEVVVEVPYVRHAVAKTDESASSSLKQVATSSPPPIPTKLANPVALDEQPSEPPSKESLTDIYRMASTDGPAILPGGPIILGLLGWDTYRNYHEIDNRLNYAWKVSVALLSHEETVARIRQTINLYGHGLHRKHEFAFAFHASDLASAELEAFAGRHPGAGEIAIPGLYSGYDPATLQSHGAPVGVKLTFERPVAIRRWSCMPISSGVVEQEMSVFQTTIWFATEWTAERAANTIRRMRDEADGSSPQNQTSFAPPRFEEFPPMPPGGISRG